MTSYVIHALVQKRAELSGDIETAHTALKRMIQELEHLDKTLLMFDPDCQVESIKPKADTAHLGHSQEGVRAYDHAGRCPTNAR